MEISKILDINTIRISRRKTKANSIALFLMLTIAITAFALPFAKAHTPIWNIPTYAYINAMPNPVGVGQTMTIYFWLDKPWPSAALANDIRPHDYTLTITKPDGTVETKTWPIVFDPTSSQYYLYTPTQVGTYNLKFDYPGQVYTWTGAYQNDTFLPSTASTKFVVQQEQIPPPITSYPLPNEYWTRPIYGESTDWWSISSNWLGTGSAVLSATGSGTLSGFGGSSAIQRYPGDAVGPETSHVVWTKEVQPGGVVGGNTFPIQGNTYFEGSAYNQRFTNPIIIYGRLYYTEPVSFTGTTAGPTNCVDLRTGQVIWSRNDVPALSFGYVYDVEDPQQHGVYPALLFTSNFARAFDAETGNPLFNVTGVPSGTLASGPQGEQLRYVIANAGNTTNPDWRLGQWNSTKLWSGMGFPGTQPTGLSPTLQNATTNSSWSMTGSTMTNSFTVDASASTGVFNRYDWNISIPWRNTMTSSPTILAAFYSNILILRNGSYPGVGTGVSGSSAPYTYFAINLNNTNGPIGSLLWMKTYDAPLGNITVSFGGADPTVGVFIEGYKETMNFVGYSMTTGSRLWGPTSSQTGFDYYGNPMYPYVNSQVAYGRFYSSGYGGILYAYDLTNGNLLWTYGNGGPGNSTNGGFAIPYGRYPTFINAVGNGIIYLVTTEHTVSTPIYKGALARAVDAFTGKEIWTLSDYTGEFGAISYAIADGFATFFNGYDNQIYSVGRGPSAITVDAPLASITQGSSLIIRGSVTDISAGTKQNEQTARFPSGVPAVSDASQTEWMAYIYQDRPRPTDAIGVDVKITVIDPNGNGYEFTTTSDSNGQYSYLWSPPVPGKYTVIAQFAGSNAYWPSMAETSFGVDQAPSAAPTSTPTVAPTVSPTTAPIVTATPTTAPNPTGGIAVETYIAIAAVVIIAIIAAAALVLRKRK